MQSLIKNICTNTGLTEEKAEAVLQTISEFIKDKYPLLSGTVDSVLAEKAIGDEGE